MLTKDKVNILYVFGGEKAQGAEIVIERLMQYNLDYVNPHLFISPGKFAEKLIAEQKPYHITLVDDLKKLNRSSTSKLKFFVKGFTNYFKVSYKVYRYIKKHHINVVHANTLVPATYLIPLVSFAHVFMKNVKWCWSDHDLKYFSNIDAAHSKSCAKLYDRTIVVSEAVKKKYEDNPKTVVLYNGLDLETFKTDTAAGSQFRDKAGLQEDAIVIGLAGSITPDKGQLGLIEVFNKLSQKHSNIKLLLAGGFAADTPEYSEKVREAVAQNNNILYLGFAENMAELYNGCDIIVNNSHNYRSEALGTTIYEAMAFKKIVVAANTGGTPEIVTDKKDGFLFETDNTNDLYSKLDYVIDNCRSLGAVRTAAREKAASRFNIKTMVVKYNEIISAMQHSL